VPYVVKFEGLYMMSGALDNCWVDWGELQDAHVFPDKPKCLDLGEEAVEVVIKLKEEEDKCPT